MQLKELERDEFRAAADLLDRRTAMLRWLVAFLRHRDRLPPEAEPYWSFWWGTAAASNEPACLLAHFSALGTCYVFAGENVDFAELEDLCRQELVPERLVGDADHVGAWRQQSAKFFAAASGIHYDVLSWDRAAAPEALPPGAGDCRIEFRAARSGDQEVLEEFERWSESETGLEYRSDFEALIEQGLIFVACVDGRVCGMVRSNLSDGRYVHAGGVFVHPNDRGRGVASQLTLGLARRLATEGSLAVLDVEMTNEPARRAYHRAGFRPFGRGLEMRFEPESWRRGFTRYTV